VPCLRVWVPRLHDGNAMHLQKPPVGAPPCGCPGFTFSCHGCTMVSAGSAFAKPGQAQGPAPTVIIKLVHHCAIGCHCRRVQSRHILYLSCIRKITRRDTPLWVPWLRIFMPQLNNGGAMYLQKPGQARGPAPTVIMILVRNCAIGCHCRRIKSRHILHLPYIRKTTL